MDQLQLTNNLSKEKDHRCGTQTDKQPITRGRAEEEWLVSNCQSGGARRLRHLDNGAEREATEGLLFLLFL